MKKLPPEGTVFMIPLRDNGFATGVVARISGDGHAFGYFFGPRLQSKDDFKLDSLDAKDALLIGKFGDRNFTSGHWDVVGQLKNWKEIRWPMVSLARIDEIAKKAWLSSYNDSFDCIQETAITVEEAANHPYLGASYSNFLYFI